jgi:hypothetical protein
LRRTGRSDNGVLVQFQSCWSANWCLRGADTIVADFEKSFCQQRSQRTLIITEVQVQLKENRAQPRYRWRKGLPGSEPASTSGVLRIHTDEGLYGEAHVRRGLIAKDVVDRRIREGCLAPTR